MSPTMTMSEPEITHVNQDPRVAELNHELARIREDIDAENAALAEIDERRRSRPDISTEAENYLAGGSVADALDQRKASDIQHRINVLNEARRLKNEQRDQAVAEAGSRIFAARQEEYGDCVRNIAHCLEQLREALNDEAEFRQSLRRAGVSPGSRVFIVPGLNHAIGTPGDRRSFASLYLREAARRGLIEE